MDIPILTTAIILQLSAAILAFRLVRLSRGWTAWTLIAAAVFLTTIRLAITLVQDAFGKGDHFYGLEEHFLSLAVAVLLVAGIYSIRPLFLAFRRSEEELRLARAEAERQAADADERRRLLEAIMEQVPEGMVIADAPDLRFRLVSRHCEEMTGKPAAAVVGRTIEEIRLHESFLRPDGAGPVRLEELPLARAARGGETVFGEEWLFRRPGGDTRTILSNAGPVRDARGEVIGGIVTWLDVTERKKAEQERERLLEENRQRIALLEAIFEATQDGIAVYGPDGELLRLNAAAREFLGLTPEEQALDIDRRWELLRVEKMDGSRLPADEVPAKKALAGENAQAILHFRPQRRASRWFTVSAAPIRSSGVGGASAVAILTDITDYHNLQENQEIFMQMISHDLRTPVTVIQGHAELLAEHLAARDELTSFGIEAILAATRQLTGMMEDLTRMIHLERGQLPLEMEPVDVAEFIAGLLRRMAVPEILTRVEAVLPAELPRIWADPESLERILTNLLTNAAKYSPPDADVRIAAEVVADELQISVSDRGHGVAPEDQPYLFDRFFRARDAGRKRGIGLGLYITRGLVESHGGRVWVESVPGEGSTFTFALPLRPVPADTR